MRRALGRKSVQKAPRGLLRVMERRHVTTVARIPGPPQRARDLKRPTALSPILRVIGPRDLAGTPRHPGAAECDPGSFARLRRGIGRLPADELMARLAGSPLSAAFWAVIEMVLTTERSRNHDIRNQDNVAAARSLMYEERE